jgi:hypothetical protein
MFKNGLLSKKISKKVAILFLAGTIAAGQSFNANAAWDFSFFGTIFKTAKENLLEALGYNKIVSGAKIAACGVAGLAGYHFLAKPLACSMFGAPAKVATKVLDTGVRWSIVAALVGAAIYLYHLYNKKELLNAINATNKNVTRTREEILADAEIKHAKLTANMNERFNATDAQLESVKKDTSKINAIKENTEKILSAVDPEVAKKGKQATVKNVKLEEKSSDL